MSDEPGMTAGFILAAIQMKYPKAAIVPEVSIDDEDLPDSNEPHHELFRSGTPAPEEHKFMRRIDALMFDSLIRTAIEIKVTADDFYRDTYWKRRAWQNVTHRFVYAVPHDLHVMTPHGIGLWKVHPDKSVQVVKRAVVSKTPDPLPQRVVQRLAYRAHKLAIGKIHD